MGVWGSGGGSEFQGYDYVQTGEPANPKEGQTWYDVDGDAAFVYDGATWVQMTVTDHGQLSGVNPGAHRSDANIQALVSTMTGASDGPLLSGGDMAASGTSGASIPSNAVDGDNSTAATLPSAENLYVEPTPWQPVVGIEIDVGANPNNAETSLFWGDTPGNIIDQWTVSNQTVSTTWGFGTWNRLTGGELYQWGLRNNTLDAPGLEIDEVRLISAPTGQHTHG